MQILSAQELISIEGQLNSKLSLTASRLIASVMNKLVKTCINGMVKQIPFPACYRMSQCYRQHQRLSRRVIYFYPPSPGEVERGGK